jgi:transcriptional regulator with XRE-family HTH domain
MPRRATRSLKGDSPLRRARLARNWTLEDVVEQIDLRSRGGASGVTPSMVSGWELGRHTTSIAHRKTLCAIYGATPEILFAHQGEVTGARATPRLLESFPELREAMLATVAGARECLVVMGSRSRDPGYLGAIENALAERPFLACYRVLFGPPHHQALKEHLVRLLELRDPEDRSLGVKTLHIGMISDIERSPERFFVASEQMAVVPIPSLTSHEGFDSGVMLGASAAARLLDHGRQAYAAATKVETIEQADGLDIVRDRRRKLAEPEGGTP